MAGYRRFVAYVYEYPHGKKGDGKGFIRVEVRDGICRMNYRLSGIPGQERTSCNIYGFVRKNGESQGISLGKCDLSGGMVQFMDEMPEGNLGGSGYGLNDLGGIILLTEEGVMYGTGWDEQPIRLEEIRLPETTEEENRRNGQENVRREVSGGYAEPEWENRERQEGLERGTREERMEPDESDRISEMPERGSGLTSVMPGNEPPRSSEMPQNRSDGMPEPMADESNRTLIMPENGSNRTPVIPENEPPRTLIMPEDESYQTTIIPENEPPRMLIMPEDESDGTPIRRENRPDQTSVIGENEPDRTSVIPENENERIPEVPGRVPIQDSAAPGNQADSAREEVSGSYDASTWNQEGEDRDSAVNILEELDQDEDAIRHMRRVQQEETESVFRRENKVRAQSAQAVRKGEGFMPFTDGDIVGCLRITPADFRMLGHRDRGLMNNNFLRHGYNRYRHVLLGKKRDGRYILGVPGTYNRQDCLMAGMFGFPNFKEAKLQSGKSMARFGYWYRLIDAPDIDGGNRF